MNLFAISGLLIGILCAILGILTFIRGKRLLHYIWGLFSFSVALWGFGSYRIAVALNPEQALLWWRIAYIGVIFIPVFFSHFIYKFLGLSNKRFIGIVYLTGLFFLTINLASELFIKEVRFIFNQFYYISSPPTLYTVFVILFFCLVVFSHIKLLQAYRDSKGIKKTQIRYFLFATIPGFFSGIFEFLPVYKIDIYPYLHFIIALSPVTVTYAILRYRLMDIRIVARKLFIYLGMAGFSYGIFYLIAWTYNRTFGDVFASTGYLLGLIIAPVFVLFFALIDKTLKLIANKYLFYSLYNYQETINKLTEELNYYIDLDKIIESIVDTIKKTMQLNRAGILLINREGEKINYQIAKVIGFNKQNGISLVQDNFLTRYLQKSQRYLVREELKLLARDSKIQKEKENFNKLYDNMKRIEASLCLPLVSGNKLLGIIVLGSKMSGDAYTKEDLELLNTLSKQAAVAVENGQLYKKVQDLSQNLQKKVDEQTKEIRKAYEVEKKARKGLERLDKAKNQFMLATQHHLRTPLTSMHGYLDLLLGGTFGKMPERIKQVLQKFKKSTKNEINIVEDLLRISQFQLGKRVVTLRPNIEIEPILKDIIEEVKIEADKKGIYVKLEKPEKIPKIKADPEKLKLAIYNIIDNAIKYTEKGGVTVKLEIQDSKLRMITKDTGMGLDKEQAEDLFNRLFERSEKAQKLYATGRGIGLYTSANLIKEHNGKIWVESEGPNKGSTFYIELPIE